jgi:hypothetical protein
MANSDFLSKVLKPENVTGGRLNTFCNSNNVEQYGLRWLR